MIRLVTNAEYVVLLMTSVSVTQVCSNARFHGVMQVERASCPIDDVVMWLPNVSETLYAIVPTARHDCWVLGWVGHAEPICRRYADPCECTNGGLMYDEMCRKDV